MESFHTLGAQVEKIQSGLEQQKIEIMKDIVMFDGLYDKNLEYFKQLQLFIQAGEEKLQNCGRLRCHSWKSRPRLHRIPWPVRS